MKKSLVDILACPISKSHPLKLRIVKENGGGATIGTLTCTLCNSDYPIKEGIPNFMPKEEASSHD